MEASGQFRAHSRPSLLSVSTHPLPVFLLLKPKPPSLPFLWSVFTGTFIFDRSSPPSLHLARSLLKAEVLISKVDRASLLSLGFTLVSHHHPCFSLDRSSSSSSHPLFFAVINVLLPCLHFLAVIASPAAPFLPPVTVFFRLQQVEVPPCICPRPFFLLPARDRLCSCYRGTRAVAVAWGSREWCSLAVRLEPFSPTSFLAQRSSPTAGLQFR